MPIAPSPIKSTCPKCGWSTVTHNRSDAMMFKPPNVCGRCGNDVLKEEKLDWLDKVKQTLFPER
jgi:ribosomal protein S27AE